MTLAVGKTTMAISFGMNPDTRAANVNAIFHRNGARDGSSYSSSVWLHKLRGQIARLPASINDQLLRRLHQLAPSEPLSPLESLDESLSDGPLSGVPELPESLSESLEALELELSDLEESSSELPRFTEIRRRRTGQRAGFTSGSEVSGTSEDSGASELSDCGVSADTPLLPVPVRTGRRRRVGARRDGLSPSGALPLSSVSVVFALIDGRLVAGFFSTSSVFVLEAARLLVVQRPVK